VTATLDLGYDSRTTDLDRRFQAARESRRVFENIWTLTMAYVLGHQWVNVDGAGMVYNVAGQFDDRVTITDNRMRPASRTNIARLSKTDPLWIGIPKDRTDSEIQRARIRGDVYEHYWREMEAARRLRLVLWYRETCGNGFWKIVWDPTAGTAARYVGVKGQGILTDANGRPVGPDRIREVMASLTPAQQAEILPALEDRDVTFGEPKLTLKTPFEVGVDPLATDEGLGSAEYITEEALYSPAYLRKHFPDIDPADLTEDGSPSAGALEGRFPGMNPLLSRSRDSRGAAGRRGVKVREYWSIPGVDGPNGKHCVWTAAGRLLLEEDSPYPFLPYTHFAGLPAGRFWADAPQLDLVSPQTELNKTRSQIAENGERFGNPARARSAQSIGLEGSDWQGLPGEEIIYQDLGTPGSIPSFIQPPEMPAYVIGQLDTIEHSIGVISGQNDVAQGTVPDGVTAASAIAQLMEANDTMLGPDVKDVADSLLDAGKKLLWCVRRFAKNDRLARIAGEESSWDVTEFTGEALGEVDGDAVQIGSAISTSVAAKQAGIQWVLNTLIQNGQAPPPRELRRILRDYEVGGLEHLFSSISRTATQVVEEHRQMLMLGQALPINSFDDDPVHLDEHQDFMRGARYALQPPPVKMAFEIHCQMHRNRLQAAANNQAAAAMIAAGGKTGQPVLDPQALGGAPPDGALPSPAA
jgi:hypothetical protein